MTFRSIVFQRTEDAVKAETTKPPPFFIDLRLDQIVDAITASKQEYNLKPFFYAPLNDIDSVKYRHEVFQDLENKILFRHMELFAHRMRAMREYLARADKLYYKYQK
jgi:DNA mismatch repair protein MutS